MMTMNEETLKITVEKANKLSRAANEINKSVGNKVQLTKCKVLPFKLRPKFYRCGTKPFDRFNPANQ